MKTMTAIVAVCVLGGCLRWPGPTGSPRVMALYGGEGGYELVHLPALSRVEVLRGPNGEGPLTLGEVEVGRLSELLRAESTYVEGPASGAPFKGDAAIQFAGAKRTIVVGVSYGQNEVRVSEGGREVGRARIVESRVGEIKKILDSAK